MVNLLLIINYYLLPFPLSLSLGLPISTNVICSKTSLLYKTNSTLRPNTTTIPTTTTTTTTELGPLKWYQILLILPRNSPRAARGPVRNRSREDHRKYCPGYVSATVHVRRHWCAIV